MNDQHMRSAVASRFSNTTMLQQADSQRFPAQNFNSSPAANFNLPPLNANVPFQLPTNAQFMSTHLPPNFQPFTHMPPPMPPPPPTSQSMFQTSTRIPPPLQPGIGTQSTYIPLRPNVPPPTMPFMAGLPINTSLPPPGRDGLMPGMPHRMLPPTSSSQFTAPPPLNFCGLPPPHPPHLSTQTAIRGHFPEPLPASRMFYESSHNNSNVLDHSQTSVDHLNSTGFHRQSVDFCAEVQQQKKLIEDELTPEVLEQNLDKVWIAGMESSVRQRSAKNEKAEMTIPEFRSLLREVILLNNKLKEIQNVASGQLPCLDNEQQFTRDDSRVSFHTDVTEASSIQTDAQLPESHLAIKARIKEIQKLLNVSLDGIQIRQKKIANKRKRLKRQRLERYEGEQENEEMRVKLREELDKWEKEEQLKQEAVKMESEMKKAADKTLLEVRRKISDAHQSLKLLTQLRKLRRLRRDQAERKGISTRTSADECFEERLTALTALMKQQLQLYEAEQRTLQVMLETEHEETKERVREKQKKKEDERLNKYEQQLNEWLFGVTEPISSFHPMAPFRLFYDLANHSTDALVNIRKEWDMHIVPIGTPGGSGIPQSWVTPLDPTDEIWASALKSSE